MRSTLFLYSNEFADIAGKIKEFNIVSSMLLAKKYLPVNSVDNTVHSELNNPISNPFASISEEIIRHIKSNNITSIILALPNISLKLVCESFRNLAGISIYILPYYLSQKDNIVKADLVSVDISKPRLKMVQVNLSQHCNLNCKGCANYSNLVSHPSFSDITQVISDFRRLKDFFWGIEHIKLMGGEPLLNPQLPEYLSKIRSLYPDAKIEIATNGTLIEKQPASLFEQMLENHIEFIISLYPVTIALRKEIETILDKAGVEYHIFKFDKQFMKYLYTEPVWDAKTAYQHCPAYGCHYLDNGYLAVCARALFANRLNDHFKTNFPENGGKWNIYEQSISPWELNSKLNSPFEFCKHCGPKAFFDWKTSNPNDISLEDWVVFG